MDREAAGREYLEQHKIPDLLYNLSALLLYHRPESTYRAAVQFLAQKHKNDSKHALVHVYSEVSPTAFSGTYSQAKSCQNLMVQLPVPHLIIKTIFQEKPKEFLIKTLERIKLARLTGTDYPYLMDESNLDAMFDMLDAAGQGYITLAQYKGALESLGLSSKDATYKETDLITSTLFKENVMKQFAEMWAAF